MGAPQALLFDVFGTCVDWYSSVARELGALALSQGRGDAAGMTLAWRRAYYEGMAEVTAGRQPWRRVDRIHAEGLTRLLPEWGFELPEPAELAALNRVWHRLAPWPDTVQGLARLRPGHYVASLSNGNLDLLIDLSRHAGVTWDTLFCSDLFGQFKPHPETYLGACRLLGLTPQAVMMVACHRGDLQAAAAQGLRTAFVARPREYGGQAAAEQAGPGEFDLVCTSFTELADRMEELN